MVYPESAAHRHCEGCRAAHKRPLPEGVATILEGDSAAIITILEAKRDAVQFLVALDPRQPLILVFAPACRDSPDRQTVPQGQPFSVTERRRGAVRVTRRCFSVKLTDMLLCCFSRLRARVELA